MPPGGWHQYRSATRLPFHWLIGLFLLWQSWSDHSSRRASSFLSHSQPAFNRYLADTAGINLRWAAPGSAERSPAENPVKNKMSESAPSLAGEAVVERAHAPFSQGPGVTQRERADQFRYQPLYGPQPSSDVLAGVSGQLETVPSLEERLLRWGKLEHDQPCPRHESHPCAGRCQIPWLCPASWMQTLRRAIAGMFRTPWRTSSPPLAGRFVNRAAPTQSAAPMGRTRELSEG